MVHSAKNPQNEPSYCYFMFLFRESVSLHNSNIANINYTVETITLSNQSIVYDGTIKWISASLFKNSDYSNKIISAVCSGIDYGVAMCSFHVSSGKTFVDVCYMGSAAVAATLTKTITIKVMCKA